MDSERSLRVYSADGLIHRVIDAVKPMKVEAHLDRIVDGLPLISSRLIGEVIVLTVIAKCEHPRLCTLGRLSDTVLVMCLSVAGSVEVIEELTWFDGDDLTHGFLLMRVGGRG